MESYGLTIWHVGRCGSSVLGQCLNQHSQLQWDNEVFNKWMPNKRNDLPIPDLQKEISAIKSRKLKTYQAIDVKLLTSQHPTIFNLSAPQLHAILSKNGYKYHILLERQNILRRMVSHCAALFKYTYHIATSSSKPNLQPFFMPTDEIKVGAEINSLIGWIEKISNENIIFKNYMNKHVNSLCLTYEESIEQDPFIGYKKICDLLSLEVEPSKVLLQRTNPFPLRDLLINYKEIKNILVNTKHEWMSV